MSVQSRVDVLIFNEPSGNVRGVITAFVTFAKGEKRVAHGTLFTDKAPDLSPSTPNRVTSEEMKAIGEAMLGFVNAVEHNDKGRQN